MSGVKKLASDHVENHRSQALSFETQASIDLVTRYLMF